MTGSIKLHKTRIVVLLAFAAALTIASPTSALALTGNTSVTAVSDTVARIMPYSKTYVGTIRVHTDDYIGSADLRIEVDATVNAQNGLIISIDGSRCLVSGSMNLDSWDLDGLTVTRDSSRVYAHVRGTAKFSWVVPIAGIRSYAEKYVDQTVSWPIE